MRIILFLLALVLLVLPASAQARTEGIAAVVNQDAISMTDLNDRMRMIIVSAGLPPSKEIQDKLLKQVLNDLIDEQLKVQEAKRKEIEVSQGEVAAGFARIASQNNLSAEQFAAAIRRDGVSPATLERQIRAQIGWSKLIQQEMRPKVIVTDTDIDDYIGRLESAKGKSEYLASEIFLPVGEGNSEADVQQLAHKLVKEITSGKTPFFKVAQQFSGAAGATRGGDLGWVQQGQLDSALEQTLAGLEKDGVSMPVRTAEGFHILYLRNLRTLTDDTIPSRDEVFRIIGIQRLERMQTRELLELRSTAFIENRVQS